MVLVLVLASSVQFQDMVDMGTLEEDGVAKTSRCRCRTLDEDHKEDH